MEKTITASFFGSGDPRREMPALLSLFLKKVRFRPAEYRRVSESTYPIVFATDILEYPRVPLGA
jgi:hypothetical protein